MTEVQFRQLVSNRRRHPAPLLFNGRTEATLVRQAARVLTTRQAAEEALEQLLPAQQFEACSVRGFRNGTLIIEVAGRTDTETIRRNQRSLLRALRRRVRAITALRVFERQEAGMTKDDRKDESAGRGTRRSG